MWLWLLEVWQTAWSRGLLVHCSSASRLLVVGVISDPGSYTRARLGPGTGWGGKAVHPVSLHTYKELDSPVPECQRYSSTGQSCHSLGNLSRSRRLPWNCSVWRRSGILEHLGRLGAGRGSWIQASSTARAVPELPCSSVTATPKMLYFI